MRKNRQINFNKRYPAYNRKHVLGDVRFGREKFVNYKSLGRFEDGFKKKLGSFLGQFEENYNDIGIQNTYRMSQKSPLRKYFDSKYRQILIQRPATDGEGEEDYVVPLDKDLVQECQNFLRGIEIFRCRVAFLPAGSILDWHIDTNTSVACRIHFGISGTCLWKIQRGGAIDEYLLEEGEILFTNTGYNHRVEALGSADRIVITVGCKPADLAKKFPEVLVDYVDGSK